ncbi:helix-turn-helix domain-containing protein [Micromonospora sp. H33]|uniref:helix-turn-helix domain-containing protein n=1 Tax=Micromonospora sp. H33 TaxID=3452215 RepID=UPI003F887896
MADDAMTNVDPGSLRTEQELLRELSRLRISAARRHGKARLSLKDLEAATGVPKSSLANYLAGRTLMPVDVLDRVVLALGVPPAEAGRWSAAWERIADDRLSAGPREPTPPDAEPDAGDTGSAAATVPEEAAGPDGPARVRRLVPAAAPLLAVGALLAVGTWFVLPAEREDRSAPGRSPRDVASSAPTFALVSGENVARIRPARTPQLCLTEGREHTGRYHSAIAVQRPCDNAEPPRTLIEPVGDGLHRIKWDHPEHGRACLTVLDGGPAKDMLEPWNDCIPGRRSQLFRIEPVDTPAPGAYRVRAAHTGYCLGIRDHETASDAEAVQQPCTDAGDQAFMIDLLPAG